MSSFFVELSLVTILAFGVSYIMQRLKQPLIIGYILTGLLVGPLVLNILVSTSGYESFAHIGIALLLFIVGMHLNLNMIKEVGPVSLLTGLGQIFFASLLGTFILTALGLEVGQALIIAIAISFSSTIIIVKMLSDTNKMDKLYGKISLGFLIVQDIVAVVLLMVLSAISKIGSETVFTIVARTLILGAIALTATVLISKYIIPPLLERVAKSSELLFIFIIAWCFGIATVFELAGFTLEVGALLAGVALAGTQYQYEISSRVKPLQDFFLVLFFIFLGYQIIPHIPGLVDLGLIERFALVWTTLQPVIFDALVVSAFILIGTPIIVGAIIMGVGYSSKTAFSVGLIVSQISEFSMIVALLALNLGLLGPLQVSLVTIVALITITVSAYFIKYNEEIYKLVEKPLRRFERRHVRDARQGLQGKKHAVVVFGLNRMGFKILEDLQKKNESFLVVDHNPQIIDRLRRRNVECIYGDASSVEFISEFDLKDIKLLISTIPEFEVSSLLLDNMRAQNEKGVIMLTAERVEDAFELYKKGADYVILPHFLGGHYVSTLVEKLNEDPNSLIQEKLKHLDELRERREFGHEHPKG
ncbi:MAG: Kef-type K+ transport system membrane component KefB [Candidatus Woesearchaeota archaeon]|jgi:Kef-type K+ transport system membrane component KefB